MKKCVAVLVGAALFAGCGGGTKTNKQEMTKFNTDLASFMEKKLASGGVHARVNAECHAVGAATTCDIFLTYTGAKKERLGDANNVRRTNDGFIWDHEA